MTATNDGDTGISPPWACDTTSNGEAVEHSRRLGSIDIKDDDPILVDLVRRDEVRAREVNRGPMEIRLAGHRLSRDAADNLCRILRAAVAGIDTASG